MKGRRQKQIVRGDLGVDVARDREIELSHLDLEEVWASSQMRGHEADLRRSKSRPWMLRPLKKRRRSCSEGKKLKRMNRVEVNEGRRERGVAWESRWPSILRWRECKGLEWERKGILQGRQKGIPKF